jgi:hypothetical protein
MIPPHDGTAVSIQDDIRAYLEAKKREATLDIRNYPQPIAGCDAQIPLLWERRDSLVEDLTRFAALGDEMSKEVLAKFVATCCNMTTEDTRKFTSRFIAPKSPRVRVAAE